MIDSDWNISHGDWNNSHGNQKSEKLVMTKIWIGYVSYVKKSFMTKIKIVNDKKSVLTKIKIDYVSYIKKSVMTKIKIGNDYNQPWPK